MRRHRVAPQAATVVTSDGVEGRARTFTKLRVVAAGLAVIALVVVMGLLVYVAVARKPDHQTTPAQHLTPLQAAQAQLQAAKTPQAKSAAYENIGLIYLNSGKATQAATNLKQALPGAKNELAVLQELSLAYRQAGQKAQALATMQQALSLMEQTKGEDPTVIQKYKAQLQALQEINT